MNKFNHLAILVCLAGLLGPSFAFSELDNVEINGALAYAGNPHMPAESRAQAIQRLYGRLNADQRSNKDWVDKLIALSQPGTSDSDAESDLRQSAIGTLGYIFSRNRETENNKLALNPQDYEENLKKVFEAFRRALENDSSAKVRGEAAFRFELLTGERTSEEMKSFISLLDPDTTHPLTDAARNNIAWALGDMPLKNIDASARQALLRGLQDPHVRAGIAAAIGKNKLNDPDMVAALRTLALSPRSQDKYGIAAKEAVKALGLIGDKSQETFQVLDHVLQAKDEKGEPLLGLHYVAAEALQCINDPEGQACYILSKYVDGRKKDSTPNDFFYPWQKAEERLKEMKAALKASPAMKDAQSAAQSPAEAVTP